VANQHIGRTKHTVNDTTVTVVRDNYGHHGHTLMLGSQGTSPQTIVRCSHYEVEVNYNPVWIPVSTN
jgi:hypothetical protein